MRRYQAAFASRFLGLLVLGTWLLNTGTAWSQAAGEGDIMIPFEQVRPDERARLKVLADGGARKPNDTRLIAKIPPNMVYQLTNPVYQERRSADGITVGRGVYDVLQNELYAIIPVVREGGLKEAQLEYLQDLNKALLPAIDRVLKNPLPIARVNAALVLVRLSETGQRELAETLIKIIEDPNQLDAVKLHALIGLKNLFRGDIFEARLRELETRCIKSVIDFVKRKPNYPPDATAEEIDAFRYVRREAIRTLGMTHYPAVEASRKVVARPAQELLAVLKKEGFTPALTPHEQVEAVIGICQLDKRHFLDYQPELAAYYMAEFIVAHADRFEQERVKSSKVLGNWKYASALLIQALQKFQQNSRDNKGVNDMVARAIPVLRSIREGQAAPPAALRDWMVKNPPEGKTLYRKEGAAPPAAVPGQ